MGFGLLDYQKRRCNLLAGLCRLYVPDHVSETKARVRALQSGLEDGRGDDESSRTRAHRALSNPTKERITSNSDLNLEEGASYADDAKKQNSAPI